MFREWLSQSTWPSSTTRAAGGRHVRPRPVAPRRPFPRRHRQWLRLAAVRCSCSSSGSRWTPRSATTSSRCAPAPASRSGGNNSDGVANVMSLSFRNTSTLPHGDVGTYVGAASQLRQFADGSLGYPIEYGTSFVSPCSTARTARRRRDLGYGNPDDPQDPAYRLGLDGLQRRMATVHVRPGGRGAVRRPGPGPDHRRRIAPRHRASRDRRPAPVGGRHRSGHAYRALQYGDVHASHQRVVNDLLELRSLTSARSADPQTVGGVPSDAHHSGAPGWRGRSRGKRP